MDITLLANYRHITRSGRITHISFNFESDVVYNYLMVDSNLVMVEHSVFSHCHFWIGNGTLNEDGFHPMD